MASRISPYVDNTGLVFAYDVANVNRSYLGQPTVNLIDSINFTTDYNTSWNAQENIIQTKNQVNPEGVVDVTAIKIESNSVTDNFFGVRGVKFASSGTNHTFSFWAKGNKAYNNFPIYFGVAQVLATVNITTEWKFFAVQTGAGVTFTEHTLHLGGWGSWTDNTFDLFLWHPQLEQKPHPTPFTTGTRSVTQGLRDLTGNSTIDLTNVSFDGNAQMTFDGTNDFATTGTGILSGTGDFTVEAVVQADASLIGGTVFGNYSAGNLQVFFGQRFIGMWLNNASTYLGTSPWSVTLPEFTTQPVHIVAQREGTTTRLYLNAVLKKTGSSSDTIGDPATGFRVGANTNGTEEFLGKIYSVRVSNRALPAPEILQNFNAIKGRYGL